MKKILFFVLAALTFVACEQALVEEQSAICPDVSETITVGFEGGNDTRIQLNEAQKTVWTKDDLVSVFYRSNANQQWKYNGETGVRTADLTCVDAGEATATMNRVVVVYPYNENYYFNTETYNVQATMPAVQTYMKDSYGLDGNIMISQSEYNDISLKNVCGWLKLQLMGSGELVKSITVRGNKGEQVAGDLYINSADATSTLASEMGDIMEDESDNTAGGAGGNLVFEDTILTKVTLDCGEGVELGTEVTAFYIALPPQTFTKGITVEITDTSNFTMTKSTYKTVTIERNHIQPMAVLFGCEENPDEPQGGNSGTIDGQWHIIEWNGEVPEFDVYIKFDQGAFEIYQQVWSLYYELYKGTYQESGDIVTGTYDDGSNWASGYKFVVEDDKLTMQSLDEQPVTCVYERCEIPAEIITEATITRSAEVAPFL